MYTPDDFTEFKKSTHNRGFIVQVDNQVLSHRNNGMYVGGYYKRFVNKRVKTLDPIEMAPHVKSILNRHELEEEMNMTSPMLPQQPGMMQQPGMIQAPPNFNNMMPPIHGAQQTLQLPSVTSGQGVGRKPLQMGQSAWETGMKKDMMQMDSIQESTTHAPDGNDYMTMKSKMVGQSNTIFNDPNASLYQQLNSSCMNSLNIQQEQEATFLAGLSKHKRSKFQASTARAGGQDFTDRMGDSIFKATVQHSSEDNAEELGDQYRQKMAEQETLSEIDSLGLFSEESQKDTGVSSNNIYLPAISQKDDIESQQSGEQTPNNPFAKAASSKKKQKGRIIPQVEPYEIIPSTTDEFDFRDFNSVKNQIRMNVVRKYKEDEIKRDLDKKAEEEAALNKKDKPKKRAPLTRKRSFTECQLKFEDALEVKQNMKARMSGPNLVDIHTIDMMKIAGKFPIPEKLMNKPTSYSLACDSFMHGAWDDKNNKMWANYKFEVEAPANSQESSDDINLYETDSDSQQQKEPSSKTKVDPHARLKGMTVVQDVIKLSNFDLAVLKDFPHKVLEGTVPIKVCKVKRPDFFEKVGKKIADYMGAEDPSDYFELRKTAFEPAMVQNIFEFFCLEFKAAPLVINKFLEKHNLDQEHSWMKLNFKNYHLNEPTCKAIACLIPFLVNVDEVDFDNNQVGDAIASVLAMAIFMNPIIKTFRFSNNHGKAAFCSTIHAVVRSQPHKLHSLTLASSVSLPDNMEKLVRGLPANKSLSDINLSGCNFSLNTCRMMSNYIIFHGMKLRDVNLSHCKISYQGTRYLIDALNRNTSIRLFNFSYNDMTSTTYEFSIKLGAIITRHPNLMHIDITSTGLKREEVLFIGLALSMSKTMLSLHLSGNTLPYYDRIFLRSLIAARVGFRFQNDAMKQKGIKNNKEFTQVMHLANGNNYNQTINEYIATFNNLDTEREQLDFEIQDMIDEMDPTEEYKNINEEVSISEVPEKSKLGLLFAKMKEREKKFHRQQQAVQDAMVDPDAVAKQLENISGHKELQKYNAEKEAAEEAKAQRDTPDLDATATGGNAFGQQQQLKVERQRQRAEKELIKEQKDRSQGELALMFMGINQIANQILNENPMTGYMSQVIFTRILGHDEIEQGSFWTDCNQCWVCSRWNKLEVRYHPVKDKLAFQKKTKQLEQAHAKIGEQVQLALQEEGFFDEKVEVVNNLNEVSEDEDDKIPWKGPRPTKSQIDGLMVGSVTQAIPEEPIEVEGLELGDSIEGQTAGRATPMADTRKTAPHEAMDLQQAMEETLGKGNAKFNHLKMNTENPISPVKTKTKNVKDRVFAENYNDRVHFNEMHLFHKEEAFRGVAKTHHFSNNLGPGMGGPSGLYPQLKGISAVKRTGSANRQSSAKKSKHGGSVKSQKINSPGESDDEDNEDAMTITQSVKVRRRNRGQPTKIEREVWFKGNVYVIEEEIYSESDKSSVYTSEDDYREDDDITIEYAKKFPLLSQKYKENAGYDSPDDRQVQPVVDAWPAYMRNQPVKQEVQIARENRKLTGPQKEYVNKLNPKHYIEKEKDKRVRKFDGPEYENAYDKLQKKNKKLIRKLRRKLEVIEDQNSPDARRYQIQIENLEAQALEDDEDEQEDIYFVASCNDWMPIKMKSRRRLQIEKIAMTDVAPPTVINLDNTQVLYSNFVAPGHHYFYFVQGAEMAMLSPNYKIVRFKQTNVFLNRITIEQKVHQFDSAFTLKEGEEDEELFLIECSVFDKYECEEAVHRKKLVDKCFEMDLGYAKIIKVCKSDEIEYKKVQVMLRQHYERIMFVFMYLIRSDDKPYIGLNDFASFTRSINAVDKALDQATIDRTYIGVNVNTHGYWDSAHRKLLRYEFLEVLVRLSKSKYNEGKGDIKCKTLSEAFDYFMTTDVYPNVRFTDGLNFRTQHCYNTKVNELLKKNQPVIERIWKTNTVIKFNPKKRFITVQECREYILAMGLKRVSNAMVGMIYYESMVLVPDTVKTHLSGDNKQANKQEEMNVAEFLVFMCRITYEHYKGSHYHSEKMYIKLEKMLPNWLAPVFAIPEFGFNHEFEYDMKQARKKRKKARKDAGFSSEEEEGFDMDSETEEEEVAPSPKKGSGAVSPTGEKTPDQQMQPDGGMQQTREQDESDNLQRQDAGNQSHSGESVTEQQQEA